MSIKLMSQVWESNLPANEKFILLALADHGRDDGSRIYPSIESLSIKTGFDRRTIQRQMRKLQSRGVLSVIKKSSRYSTVEYFVNVDKLVSIHRGGNLSPLKSTRGGRNDASGAAETTPRGGRNDGEGRQAAARIINEPSSNHKKQPANSEILFFELIECIPKLQCDVELQDRARAIFYRLSSWEQGDLIWQGRPISGRNDATDRAKYVLDVLLRCEQRFKTEQQPLGKARA